MDIKIIAVDFDGTLVENKWPEIGSPNWEVINELKAEQEKGAKTILWTCRVDEKLKSALNFLAHHGITFDAVNENIPEIIHMHGTDCRKVYADEYWDDRAVQKPRSIGDMQLECLNTINEARAKRKLPPLDFGELADRIM